MTYIKHTSKKQIGVTLIELLVMMAILAITASFALPSYKAFISDRQISATSQGLHQVLQIARSNAVMGDGGGLIPVTESGALVGWKTEDSANNAVAQTRKLSSTITVKAFEAAIDNAGEVTKGTELDTSNSLTFNAYGALDKAIVFNVCHGDDGDGRELVVSRLGRVLVNYCTCNSGECI